MQTLRIERRTVHADWQWPSMRKRSPEALYCCTIPLKTPISPANAPKPTGRPLGLRSAETEPSAQADVSAHVPTAQKNKTAASARVDGIIACPRGAQNGVGSD